MKVIIVGTHTKSALSDSMWPRCGSKVAFAPVRCVVKRILSQVALKKDNHTSTPGIKPTSLIILFKECISRKNNFPATLTRKFCRIPTYTHKKPNDSIHSLIIISFFFRFITHCIPGNRYLTNDPHNRCINIVSNY